MNRWERTNEPERCSFLSQTVHSTCLPGHTLNQHSDCHSTRERVRVDNNIRLNPTLTKRHIDGGPFLRTHTLLTVSRGEFVADDRWTRDSDGDVYFLQFCVTGVCAYVQ
jgi:hypothetical protein